jgi:predicted amidohydrolase YtcJ
MVAILTLMIRRSQRNFPRECQRLDSTLESPTTVESMMKSLELAMDYAASLGITSVQTMDLNAENAEMMLEAYTKILEKRPTLRVYQHVISLRRKK